MVGGGADRTSPAGGAVVGGGTDRTSPAILSALARIPALARRPGTAYAYSGAGYVCLAGAVERAAGQPLPGFARERIFAPLGMSSTRYWPGPAPVPPGAAPLQFNGALPANQVSNPRYLASPLLRDYRLTGP